MTTLFLKYRPQNFSDIVGQSATIKTLQNAIKNNRAAHAYLLVGSRGTGKTSSARILAKALNSHDPATGEVVETDLTQKIAAGECVDIIEIDAASHTGVDNIRDLIDKVQFLPTYAQKKVYIIDEVHMLSKGAFNALLKTLEEPPEHAYFILATTELHKVPDTIVSRCQTFTFSRFTLEQIVDRLQKVCEAEGITAEKTALEIIAKKAEGGLRDAISLLEQISAESDNTITEIITRQTLGISDKETLEIFWQAISAGQTQAGLDIIAKIRQDGADLRMFGHDFLRFLQTLMKASLNQPTLPKILQAIDVIEQALQRLKSSPIIELPLEIAVVKMGQNIQRVESRDQRVEVSRKEVKNEAMKDEKIVETQNLVNELEAKQTQPTSPFSKGRTEEGFKNLPTAAEIQNQLETISQTAGLPIFVKKSFLTNIPKVKENTIEFGFGSMFHYEQVNKPVHIQAVTNAINKIYGVTATISFVPLEKETIPAEQAKAKATFDDLEF